PQPTVKELAEKVGVTKTYFFTSLQEFIDKNKNRKIHFFPPYRGNNKILLSELLNIPVNELKAKASTELIKASVSLRSIKSDLEIAEIEKACEIGYKMHTTAMKMAKLGVIEQEIAGTIEGIALSYGSLISFPVILSQNGETLHNHNHHQILTEGRLLLVDCGAENNMNYCSDNTRTFPVGGKFSDKQKQIYEVCLKANTECIKAVKSGVFYKDIHFLAAKIIVEGLKNAGIMKGDVDKAVEAGAHTLFMPHGLGHMMGLDVHDMENYGEDFVGYDDEIKRSSEFGTAYLRLARKLQPGFVLTVEPGIYFIPELISKFKNEGKFFDFVNYDLLEKEYLNFGGIRIEDDVLVTENGYRVLGRPIPKTVKEIEDFMNS
ncbi:MAG: aminopeptidase P family protein, partial [Bacteroidetes bacterium]